MVGRKQQANEKVVQLLQHDNMHKFKYYKTMPDKMVQDDKMHKYFKYYNTVEQTSMVTAFLRCSDGNDVHVH
jgi:hypothetical protein